MRSLFGLRAGKVALSVPFGDRETIFCMRFRTADITVMAAESHLELMQHYKAIGARLPIPKQDESLTADAAVGFSVPFCLLAKYLHPDLMRAGTLPLQR